MTIPPVNQAHGRGQYGEQTAAFLLGQKGYVILDGPSGAGGHGITTPGLDGAAYNPRTDDLLIYDNKSLKRGGNVSGASAITRNLARNMDSLIQRLNAVTPTLPPEARTVLGRVMPRLQSARQSLNGVGQWPPNCRLAITAEAGNSTGVTPGLAGRNVVFVDIATL